MRRGESLRFEVSFCNILLSCLWFEDGGKLLLFWHGLPPFCQDVMILDQSVFFGVADIHDRHRDMRLDVDNMSYEVNFTKNWSTHFILFFCLLLILIVIQYIIGIIGVIGTGRAHWKCQHGIEWRNNIKSSETAEAYCGRVSTWGRTLLYLSGKCDQLDSRVWGYWFSSLCLNYIIMCRRNTKMETILGHWNVGMISIPTV